MLTDWLIL